MKTQVLPRPRSKQTLNTNMQTPFEELLETPVDLPITEPETAQYEWTIASGDLLTFSMTLISVVYIARFFTAGKNVSGATRTVYLRGLKNGESVNTATKTIDNNDFYTFEFNFYDAVVGDVYGIKLWASDTGMNRDYQAHQVQLSRPFVLPAAEVMKPLDFSTLAAHPVLTLGNPKTYSGSAIYYYPPNLSASANITTAGKIEEARHHSTYGLFRLSNGDLIYKDTAGFRDSATYRPFYYTNWIPTQISFRSYGELT